MSAPRVMGLYCGHDAGVALIEDERIVSVLVKERFTRQKGAAGDVDALIVRALRDAGWSIGDIDFVATSRGTLSPSRSGILCPAAEYGRGEFESEHRWKWGGAELPALSVDHHLAHAALSFYPSPFEEAAVMILDGGGDWGDAALFASGSGSRLRPLSRPPVNLGLMWHLLGATLGLPWAASPGQLMALAAYGLPLRRREIIDWGGGLLASLSPSNVAECVGPLSELIWSPWVDRHQALLRSLDGTRLGIPEYRRFTAVPPFDREAADLAASLQLVTEETMLFLADELAHTTGQKALCLGGGVALNCLANERLVRSGPFTDVFSPPAVHDGGLALGAAIHGLHLLDPSRRRRHDFARTGWGRRYSRSGTADLLGAEGLRFVEISSADVVALKISEGALVGFFEGGAEIGPRALGHRSLLADPRNPAVRDRLNAAKRRAPYRPVAPSMPTSKIHGFFPEATPCPFMTRAAGGGDLAHEKIPGALHRDGTARVQAVPEDGSFFRQLHDAFEREADIPALLQTSFNRREPLVETPEQALVTARLLGLDALFIDGFWIEKLS